MAKPNKDLVLNMMTVSFTAHFIDPATGKQVMENIQGNFQINNPDDLKRQIKANPFLAQYVEAAWAHVKENYDASDDAANELINKINPIKA